MTGGLQVVLMLFAIVGYGGAGAALAVARYRELADGARDLGMLGVGAMLFFFGALCTTVSVGLVGVPAVGGVALWASYLFMAQHMEVFRVEVQPDERLEAEASETPRTRR